MLHEFCFICNLKEFPETNPKVCAKALLGFFSQASRDPKNHLRTNLPNCMNLYCVCNLQETPEANRRFAPKLFWSFSLEKRTREKGERKGLSGR